jgi:hypothetical protein
MRKLTRKCVMLEINLKNDLTEENGLIKIWYGWNSVIKCWQRHRLDGPTLIDQYGKVWYNRGIETPKPQMHKA